MALHNIIMRSKFVYSDWNVDTVCIDIDCAAMEFSAQRAKWLQPHRRGLT